MEKVAKILLTLRIILHKQSLILESNHYLAHHHHLWMNTNQRLLLHNPLHLKGIWFESDNPIFYCWLLGNINLLLIQLSFPKEKIT
jgi:hypothetical protein